MLILNRLTLQHVETVFPMHIDNGVNGELGKRSDISIKVSDLSISPIDDPPRNLSVIFDSTRFLDAHMAKLYRSINFNLYSLGKTWKYLDKPTTGKLINATVTSRLNYCNNLLYGAKLSQMDRLQCFQNNAARIISKRRKFYHKSPCWENCTGFPWSIGPVTKFFPSLRRHWMAMLCNISQH